jgi:signal transduction histidine kinase/ActR/RegA family two-component response regulator
VSLLNVEDRLRLLESCVRGIVFELDAQGRFLEVWTHDETLLAAPRSQIVGRTIEQVLGPKSDADFAALIKRALEQGAPARLEYPLTVLGGPRWFTAEAFPGRRPGTVVVLVQDISDRKQLEARVLETERLAAIGVLAGGVGHEINNPLAWLMTHLRTVQAELKARAPADPDCTRWVTALSEALEGGERIRQIVQDLSFFTRNPEAENRPVDLRRALDWAVDMATAELRPRARLVKAYGRAPLVWATEGRLGQVFLNLLINAAHAIDEGAAHRHEVRIELSTDEQGRAQVDVTDTGGGIAPEHVAHLFEPFFTTKPSGIGTGLGLAVSRRLVEALGGSIELQSSQPGTTRFRVTLPAAAATAIDAPPPSPRSARAEGPRLKVLLIDDQPRFLSSLQLALTPVFDVETESSGRAALGRVARGAYDAIVCDLMMPDFTGMDFYEAMAARDPALAARIVFMTGGAFTPRAQQLLARIPNERLEKPFRPDELEKVLLRLAAAGPMP